jgi:uncharacterized LabA/DUF88 family protein
MASLLVAPLRAENPTQEEICLAAQTIQKSLSEQLLDGPFGQHRIVRKYWFGSIQGSPEILESKQLILRQQGYEGVLFQKIKGKAEKGVDIAVAREMLMHGFHKTYDTAVIIAGDEDYLGLVQDVKRLGLIVVGMFYETKALSPKLHLAFDHFIPLHYPQGVQPSLVESIKNSCEPC